MRSGNPLLKLGTLVTAAFVAGVFGLTLLLSTSGLAQTVTTLQNFNGPNGANPFLGALVQGRDGNLYGTTYSGGANGIGTVFRFNRADNHIAVIHSFAGTDGSSPAGGLTLDTDGYYYGTTNYGGSAGLGVLFRINSSGVYTVLHSFLGGSDGENPNATPVEASDGNLYGATTGGSPNVPVTIYKYTRAGVYSIISTFDTATGTGVMGMIQGSDSMLYVTTNGGGAGGCGSIVELTLAGVVNQVHSFDCEHDEGGANPVAPLVEAADGNYYGTTPVGGTNDFGVLFRMRPGLGELVMHTFTSSGVRFPQGGLVQGTDGNLYGVSENGGNLEGGILYSFNPSTLAYAEYYQFTGVQAFTAPLMQHTSGLFYGPSWVYGAHNEGFIYSVDMGLGPFVAFVRPAGTVGGTAEILGQALTGATGVTFNGVAATSFTVVSDTYITAVVPSGATTGAVVVTTPGGTLTSNMSFKVFP